MDKWYVAAMNDCIFIVDQEPRPAPVDHVNPNAPAPTVVISMRSGSREAQEIAEQIVSEHNAAMARVCGLLDCPMCDARKKFVINPLDATVGYCMAEQRAWRVTSLTCLSIGCLKPKATFGDYCMSCLEQRVNAEIVTSPHGEGNQMSVNEETGQDALITVCDNCSQASCWQGEFYCDEYKTAGITQKTRAELAALNRENPS